ncbi:hypothetical protein ABFA07_020025 [Porites harrisoni]
MAARFGDCRGIILSLVFAGRIFGITRLEPERPLFNQVLQHQETVVYHLVQLKPGKNYELRVSYRSTTPTDFYIRLIPKYALQLRDRSRQLLNIDKLVFNNQLTDMEQFANVTVIRTGVPLNPASLGEPVLYNIVLEELFFGVPWHVWKLVVLVIGIIIITVRCLVPRTLAFIEENVLYIHKKRSR